LTNDTSNNEVNLLELIPVHNIEWELISNSDLVVLKKPKFTHPVLRKYLLPHLKDPNFKIKLDAVGSVVWKNINGQNKVYDIAKILETKFGASVQPVYNRIALFVKALEKHKFIALSDTKSLLSF
jgi:hypothetical protein